MTAQQAAITADHVRERLLYDPDSGIFKRKVTTGYGGRFKAGEAAGGLHPSGYMQINILGRQYASHRVAWLYVHGEWPKENIDHINGDRSDNRIANLRDVSRSTNAQNRRTPKAGSASGYLGVSWYSRGNRWLASIRIGKKLKHLGLYSDPKDAYAAYLVAKRELHIGNTL